MKRRRLLLGVIVCAGIVACGAVATRVIIARHLQLEADEDFATTLANFKNAPPPPLREKGFLTPYDVESQYRVIETGGPERARSSFVDDDLGLEIEISIHTCRPRVMHDPVRGGEINLVDGSTIDQCTSGGVMNIVDRQRGETFEIQFKLIGAPNGTIGWNARQLVSPRGSETWRQSLERLRHALPQDGPPAPPPTVQRDGQLVESRDSLQPHALLMFGESDEMLKLLAYRSEFRDFYENPDSPHAQQVARMLIDSLLESPEQQELSKKWAAELGEAG